MAAALHIDLSYMFLVGDLSEECSKVISLRFFSGHLARVDGFTRYRERADEREYSAGRREIDASRFVVQSNAEAQQLSSSNRESETSAIVEY